jgi:hypothetical protein
MKLNESQPPLEPLHPFAAAAGIRASPRNDRDPFEQLDDLMTVVEALCPRWPGRATFSDGGRMLL